MKIAVLVAAAIAAAPTVPNFEELLEKYAPETLVTVPPAPVEVAHLSIEGAIDEDSAADFIKALKQPAHAYVIHIDTPGGDLDAALRMSIALEAAADRADVTCIVDGKAASAGFFVLESCTWRVMTTRSLLMAHEPIMPTGGSYLSRSELRNIDSALEGYTQVYSAQCAARMSITVDEFRARIRGREWWVKPGEALQLGAIDEIAPSPNTDL